MALGGQLDRWEAEAILPGLGHRETRGTAGTQRNQKQSSLKFAGLCTERI
jgi:hypothetical protein